jgi:hypothetical protein
MLYLPLALHIRRRAQAGPVSPSEMPVAPLEPGCRSAHGTAAPCDLQVRHLPPGCSMSPRARLIGVPWASTLAR